MKHLVLGVAVVTAAAGAGLAGWLVASRGAITVLPMVVREIVEPEGSPVGATTAFFYQSVGRMENGVGENATRAGWTEDGVTIFGEGNDVLDWEQSGGHNYAYGDPVYSLLSNGNWAVTARAGGSQYLMYGESSCPLMDDSKIIAIGPSTAPGCKQEESLTLGKTSEIFSIDGGNYVFHMVASEIYLAKLSDETHSVLDLESMCLLEDAVSSIDDIGYGDSAPVLSSEDLLLSDTAIAQREDGTWVLFVKGISRSGVCSGLCELCSRKIYRTTSTDLVTWTPLEMVVEEASVPEAYTDVHGVVWLYWQDFSDACAAQNELLGAIAPIASAYEQPVSYALSVPERITIVDEAFQTDKAMHYATNGNPVALRTAEAREAFAACIGE